MSLFDKIKSKFSKPEEPPVVVTPPRPTSLSERKQKGMNVGVDAKLKNPDRSYKPSGLGGGSNDPYSTAAWEVDPESGRRRLKNTNPVNTNKHRDEFNPYDTSDELDPWKKGK